MEDIPHSGDCTKQKHIRGHLGAAANLIHQNPQKTFYFWCVFFTVTANVNSTFWKNRKACSCLTNIWAREYLCCRASIRSVDSTERAIALDCCCSKGSKGGTLRRSRNSCEKTQNNNNFFCFIIRVSVSPKQRNSNTDLVGAHNVQRNPRALL